MRRALGVAPAVAAGMLFAAALAASGCASTGTPAASKVAGDGASTPIVHPDAIAAELDSLAAVSVGPYVHLRIGQCFGWCELRVSIHRDSPAHRYVYDAEGYRFDHEERRPVLLRERRQISQAEATRLLTDAVDAGLFSLVADTTMTITDQPYFWLRAGGGPPNQAVSIDRAYTGGERYAPGTPAGEKMSRTFFAVRDALAQRLFATD